jgi:hypothetical protein
MKSAQACPRSCRNRDVGAGMFAAGAPTFTGRNYQLARQTLEVN